MIFQTELPLWPAYLAFLLGQQHRQLATVIETIGENRDGLGTSQRQVRNRGPESGDFEWPLPQSRTVESQSRTRSGLAATALFDVLLGERASPQPEPAEPPPRQRVRRRQPEPRVEEDVVP
jgi:hypothetical protein